MQSRLGFIWNTVNWTIALKKEREVKLRNNAKELLQAESASCRVVAAFLGRTNSATGAVPLARASPSMGILRNLHFSTYV